MYKCAQYADKAVCFLFHKDEIIRIFDIHFTDLVFWILHSLGMINPYLIILKQETPQKQVLQDEHLAMGLTKKFESGTMEQVVDALVREVKSRHVRRLRDGLQQLLFLTQSLHTVH